jgi:xanthine phosphoribosyltransferase
MEPTKLTLTWCDYFKLCDILIGKLAGNKFTDIVAISRGGLIPAQYIAYKLDIPRVHNFGVSSYSKENVRLHDDKVVVYQKVTMHFNENHHVLVIDDIADTGKTIKKCLGAHWMFAAAANVKLSALHYKLDKSVIKPDYYAQIVDANTWIEYPYD